MRGLVWFSVSN